MSPGVPCAEAAAERKAVCGRKTQHQQSNRVASQTSQLPLEVTDVRAGIFQLLDIFVFLSTV